MSKGKDPAFLFYSKDWIEGTAEMLPEEKGVYIDLLCQQHQSGSLPNDIPRLARIARLSVEEFSRIWSVLSSKFQAVSESFGQPNGNRLVNRRLHTVVTERSTVGKTNKIIGTFAALVRQSKLSQSVIELVKKEFKVTDYTELPTELITERLTEWFQNRSKSIVNVNTIVNEDIRGGAGGEQPNGSTDWIIDGKIVNSEMPIGVLHFEAIQIDQCRKHPPVNSDNYAGWINSMWPVFLAERKAESIEKKSQYKTIADLQSYFVNWIRNKTPEEVKAKKNGTHLKNNSAIGHDVPFDRP